MELSLRRTLVADRHVLVVTGDVDLGSLPRFNDSLARLVADDPGKIVVVDLDGAGLIEDAALGLLLGTNGRATASEGSLHVVCTEPRLRKRLADTGFDKAVVVTSSISGS